jgi:hypothetical protein
MRASVYARRSRRATRIYTLSAEAGVLVSSRGDIY